MIYDWMIILHNQCIIIFLKLKWIILHTRNIYLNIFLSVKQNHIIKTRHEGILNPYTMYQISRQ